MKRALLAMGPVLLLSACAQRPDEHEVISFADHVQPILYEHCTLCHAADIRQGGIALDSYQNLISSRYFNRPTPLVIPEKPTESRLFLVIHSTSPGIRMPPPGTGIDPPDEAEIETIRLWIQQGALDN